MKQIKKALVFLFSVSLLLSGCLSNTESVSQNGVEVFGVCTPPCWAGVIPGSTTRTEAEDILRAYYGDHNVDTTDDFSIYWTSNSTDVSNVGWLSHEDGIVDLIDIQFPEDRITVNDIFSELGDPEYVRLTTYTVAESGCAGAILLYPELGVKVFPYPYKSSGGVYQTQSVHTIQFSEPFVDTVHEVFDAVDVDWAGFKDYCK